MKKLLFFVFTLTLAVNVQSQDFGIGISGGYLTELEGIGGTVDLIYNIDEKWSVATDFTYAVADENSLRSKWSIFDLNVRYKVYDEFYLLGGGEYLSVSIKDLGLAAGNPLGTGGVLEGDDFGANVGGGYIYNILDNVNAFAEVKYVLMDNGYIHARVGILFDL